MNMSQKVMVSQQDTEWKVFPRFLAPTRSTLLLDTEDSRAAWRAKAPKTKAGLRRNDSDALLGPRGLVSDSTPISNRGWTMSLSQR